MCQSWGMFEKGRDRGSWIKIEFNEGIRELMGRVFGKTFGCFPYSYWFGCLKNIMGFL